LPLLLLGVALLGLGAACSSDDPPSSASRDGAGSTTSLTQPSTSTSDAGSDTTGSAPSPDGDGETAPSVRPGPPAPQPPRAAPSPPAPAPAGQALDRGLVSTLIDRGYSGEQAECIADGVFSTFNAVDLTTALRHLGDPANQPAGSIAGPLGDLIAACGG
jgi:hypothetical protein